MPNRNNPPFSVLEYVLVWKFTELSQPVFKNLLLFKPLRGGAYDEAGIGRACSLAHGAGTS